MVKVVCADGRVLDEIIDREWLRAQVAEIDSNQITTPSGHHVSFSTEVAVGLRENCRKMTAIPRPRSPVKRSSERQPDRIGGDTDDPL